MSATNLTALIARCRILCRPRLQSDDAELLRRFTQQRDAAAFEELLERYAPLVWGACRRMLTSEADCEDAFQATFLALVRRPPTPPSPNLGEGGVGAALGGWLHTVALRVIRKAQARARRQRPQATLAERGTAGDVADEVGSRELLRLVDEEIERLPALLRLPLILCCLQGRTRDEAAEMLGCSVAAVKSRLERGRNLLRQRLEKRGMELPAAFLVLGLTTERIRAALWAATIQSVLNTPTQALVSLAESGVSAASIGKGKLFLAVLLLASSAAGAAGVLLREKPAETPAFPQEKAVVGKPKKSEAPQIRLDRHGDPLPEGAIARLGTMRWRHGFFISALAYSPDGKMIAATGGGRAITLWEAATGKEIYRFPNRGQPNAVAFSPDGRIFATTWGSACLLWDVATGKEIRQLNGHENGLRSVAFAPDGKTLATSSYDGTARIWETSTGKGLRRLDCKQGFLFSAAYSPDGKILATGSEKGTIQLWDLATGTERRRLEGHKKGIWDLVFSPHGKHLASSSDDETVRLWDPATGRQVRALDEKMAGPRSPIVFSPDGALLAIGRWDGTVLLWDMVSGKEKRRWQAGAHSFGGALAFSPDSKTLATGYDGTIRQWDVATGQENDPTDEHRGIINLLRFSPKEKLLISIGTDRRLLSWDLVTNATRQSLPFPAKRWNSAVLSPNGETLAYDGWPDSHLRLWNVPMGKLGIALGKPQKRPIWKAIAFSPRGRHVAAQGDDGMIHVWDVAEGREVHQLKGLVDHLSSLSFSPDDKVLAGGTDEHGARQHAVHLWDVNSSKGIRSFKGVGPIYALDYSPDGKMLAIGGGDPGDAKNSLAACVQLYDTATGAELCRHTGHREGAGPIAFSPDGKLVVSGSGYVGQSDNSVHVWEGATGSLIRRFEGHHSCVGSVAFSPDGLTVASGAGDSTILLWDITGRRADGRWHTKPLTSRQLNAYWETLANEDAAKAYDAVWALIASPEQAVSFLRRHLPPVARPDPKTVARRIADLDCDDFMVRQKATEQLTKLGDAIAPALRQALASKPTLEMRRRIQQLLDQGRDWTAERLRDHRAIQALEHIGTREAKEVLDSLAEGAGEATRTEEAKAALRRLSRAR